MRKIVLSLMLLLACAPAWAVDWGVVLESGVNNDEGLESRMLFKVQRFNFDLRARTTDWFGVEQTPKSMLHPWACGRSGRCSGTDPVLVWSSGLQWSAELHYRAFPQHGPVARFSRFGDNDETWFLGWRGEFGSYW